MQRIARVLTAITGIYIGALAHKSPGTDTIVSIDSSTINHYEVCSNVFVGTAFRCEINNTVGAVGELVLFSLIFKLKGYEFKKNFKCLQS